MPGLTAALSIATQSLMVQQEALQVATNNIANANTPGYSREVLDVTENQPVPQGSLWFGTGATCTTGGFQQRLPSGALSPTTCYAVPAGKYLVVTDVAYNGSGGTPSGELYFYLDFFTGPGAYLKQTTGPHRLCRWACHLHHRHCL